MNLKKKEKIIRANTFNILPDLFRKKIVRKTKMSFKIDNWPIVLKKRSSGSQLKYSFSSCIFFVCLAVFFLTLVSHQKNK